ncbi:unnamed protein product [Porites lobata]|uniref:Conodipine-M alpha chain n=1 Tax=Porites lobata TaxID=104759 RepID=A0ABN8P5H8_9CNID|nr:unnamed protein product [Porites lobata]
MRLSALCAVLSLLVVLFLISEVTSCYVKVNGCSIPGKLPFFYKRTFRNACNKHDVCYYCGRHYKWRRLQCDKAFQRDMKKVCSNKYRKGWLRKTRRRTCMTIADVYYRAVRIGGAFYFKNPTPSWCLPSCAKDRGNPTKSLSRSG